MPNNTPNINLDVRNWASTDPGWHIVNASNGQPYSYSYSGGDDGVGGLISTAGQGRDTAPLQLVADQRYQINQCSFQNDTQNQLSWNGQSPRAGSIVDANVHVEDAEYSILVMDTGNGNCTIQCDPDVKIKPPALNA
jgi:hypothetical protein